MAEGARPWQSPPVKVLAAQLRRCRRAPGGPWLLEREESGRTALAVPLVWMQGTVLSVGQGGSTVRLRDGSGPFVAQGVESVPKGRPCLSVGKYVMVLGLVQSCGPEPTLRAVKLRMPDQQNMYVVQSLLPEDYCEMEQDYSKI